MLPKTELRQPKTNTRIEEDDSVRKYRPNIVTNSAIYLRGVEQQVRVIFGVQFVVKLNLAKNMSLNMPARNVQSSK